MIYIKDDVIYDDLWSVLVNAAVVKGQAALIQDVFGFYMTNIAAGEEGAFIYRCRQVHADKVQGTGEAIFKGDRLYYLVTGANAGLVSPNTIGVAGVDQYFCGWAKNDAPANAEQVWMNFDGTRWDENLAP